MSKEDLTKEVLDDYKDIIINYKIKLPESLINYIVNEFIDDRNSCCMCQLKCDYYDGDLTCCNKCNRFICYDCVFDKSIRCTNTDCCYCMSGCCYNNRSENYCDECKELYSVSSNESDNFDYFDMLEEIKKEENKRKQKLLKAIKKANLEFRNDSQLYKEYINGTRKSLT
jgi:hypothetical protein